MPPVTPPPPSSPPPVSTDPYKNLPPLETPLGKLHHAFRLAPPHSPEPLHFNAPLHYGLVLVLGTGRYRDQRGCDQRLHHGDVILLFPDVAHHFGPESGDPWESIHLGFSGPAFEAWRLRGLSPARPIWPARLSLPWHPAFFAFVDSPARTLPDACLHLARVHAMVASFLDSTIGPPPPAWLAPVCQLLSSPRQRLTVPALARQAGFATADAFRRAFVAATGSSPSEYRRHQIMARAAHLLHDPSLTLACIAEQLEICDAFQLSRLFKQHHGLSPLAYRKRLRIRPNPRCVNSPMPASKKPMAHHVRLSGSSSNPPVFNNE